MKKRCTECEGAGKRQEPFPDGLGSKWEPVTCWKCKGIPYDDTEEKAQVLKKNTERLKAIAKMFDLQSRVMKALAPLVNKTYDREVRKQVIASITTILLEQ
jgi:hypothetical protein